MSINYKPTIRACYLGLVVQAISNTMAPILFIVFKDEFGISIELLGRLILVNFTTQIITDIIAVRIVDRVGYRILTVLGHGLAFLGLLTLGILPYIFSNSYFGLVIPVMLYAIGGGLNEVIMSPIVESVPSDDKAGAMSLLHSFYCWGQVAVITITTISLWFLGRDMWYVIPICWSIVPLFNMFNFTKVPLIDITTSEKGTPLKSLFKKRMFLIVLVIMLCAGASEMVMSQWASLFAENGLGVSKVFGDLLGPCMFFVLMGLGRTFYGIRGSRLNIHKALIYSSLLCVISYIITVISPFPILSLVSCAICGLSVALMWPGATSIAASKFSSGGAGMFGVLAIFGDIGCSVGPWSSGVISDYFVKTNKGLENVNEIGLKYGIAFGTIFPVILLLCLFTIRSKANKSELK